MQFKQDDGIDLAHTTGAKLLVSEGSVSLRLMPDMRPIRHFEWQPAKDLPSLMPMKLKYLSHAAQVINTASDLCRLHNVTKATIYLDRGHNEKATLLYLNNSLKIFIYQSLIRVYSYPRHASTILREYKLTGKDKLYKSLQEEIILVSI
jgi:hypothetical protein